MLHLISIMLLITLTFYLFILWMCEWTMKQEIFFWSLTSAEFIQQEKILQGKGLNVTDIQYVTVTKDDYLQPSH